MAAEWGKLSYCERKKVGALIVKNNMIISDGYTKWYVLHAEANAITKIASSTQSSDGATLYISLSPCKESSKLIHQAKIKRVVFNKAYKDKSGLDFLEKAGIELTHIPDIT